MEAAYATALSRLDAEGRTEFWASLALRHTRNLGARSIRRLLGHFGSALEAVQGVRDWDAAGVRADRAAGLIDNSWRTAALPEWNAAKALVGRILLWTDPDYPERLRELPDAPVLLYGRGRFDLLRGPCLAIVGKRQCSPEGLRAATYFASTLAAAGVTIVSGLALGVDQAAHKAALGKPGGTLAVLGTGIDHPYPRSALALHAQIAETGLLISEFAPGTTADPRNFPIRNRIISGLSLGVLVVEAAPRSGSLITARLALEQNRTVYAVPGALGAPTAQGCQELIRQGASPVFAASDILADLLPHLRQSLAQPSGSLPDAPSSEQPVRLENGLENGPENRQKQGTPNAPEKNAPTGTRHVAHDFSHGIPACFTIAPPPPDVHQPPKPTHAAQTSAAQTSAAQTGAVSAPKQPPPPAQTAPKAGTHAGPQTDSHSAPRPAPAFRPDSPEGRLLAALDTAGSGTALDTLDELLDLPPAVLTALLVRLEVQGLVRRLPGQYFMLAHGGACGANGANSANSANSESREGRKDHA